MNDIRKFWDNKAIEHGTSHMSSWDDRFCMDLEIATLERYLEDEDQVLDIGCGNGQGTLQLALSKRVKIKGIDYSSEMITAAQKKLSQIQEAGMINFEVGDVMHMQEPADTYTKAMTRRVIINLGTLENQIKAARQIHAILKPEGLFLMSEATIDGLNRINKLRKEIGLSELSQPWHNCYIDSNLFIEGIREFFDLLDIVNFSSTYYIGSRVVQPFIKRILDQTPSYNSEINRWFSQMAPVGDYGIQKLFVLRKK